MLKLLNLATLHHLWETHPFLFIGDFAAGDLVSVCITPVGVGTATVGMVTVGMVTDGKAAVGMATVGDSTVAIGCSGCIRFTRWLRATGLERPALRKMRKKSKCRAVQHVAL